MKRYLFDYPVIAVNGVQTFYVDAESLCDARTVLETSGGTFYRQEVEVLDLGKPEHAGETSLDDFGDGT